MAAINELLQIIKGNTNKAIPSQTLEVLFKALGIGTNNIQIREKAGDPDVLEIVGKIKVQDGVAADEVSTKGQLDAVEGSVGTAYQAADAALQSQIDDNVSDIAILDDRLETAESDITSLDGRVTTNEGNITQLQTDLNTIESNNPAEAEFIADGVGKTYTLSTFSVSSDNTVRDIEVFVAGRRQIQSTDGTFTGNKGFRKNSTTEIELATPPTNGDSVVVWKQGTAVIVSGGGGVDLQNINVDLAPDADGARAVGTNSKAFSGVFLKDQTTGTIYRLEVDNGILQAVTV